jgi:hypothetical protein
MLQDKQIAAFLDERVIKIKYNSKRRHRIQVLRESPTVGRLESSVSEMNSKLTVPGNAPRYKFASFTFTIEMSATTQLFSALFVLLSPTSATLWVHTPNISAAIDTHSGSLVSTNTSVFGLSDGIETGISWDVLALFTMGDNNVPPVLLNSTVDQCGDAVCIQQWVVVHGQYSNASCCTPYTVNITQKFYGVFAPDGLPSSICWSVTSTSTAPLPWRTTALSSLDVSAASLPNDAGVFWAPMSGNASLNQAGVWGDVLAMRTSAESSYALQYGTGFLFEPDTGSRAISPVPAAVLASTAAPGAGAGLAFFAAVDDVIFGLAADVSPASAAFRRYYNRQGGGRAVSSTHYLVPLAGADWRPAFQWARAAFPRFFLSPTLLSSAARGGVGESAGLLSRTRPPLRAAAPVLPAPVPPVVNAGLGLYSCAGAADMNTSQLNAWGATHNWVS